jgi:beta-lactamase class A
MTLLRIFGTAIALAGVCASSVAPPGQKTASRTERDTTRSTVENLIQQSGAQGVVAFRSLDGSRELFINADEEFPATNQWVEIAVMIELRARAQERQLKFADTLLVENSFRSTADGSNYRLDPGRDHDRELYRETGRRVSLQVLETHMMKQNSELATNLLIQLLGIAPINERLANLQASGVRLRHGFQDLKAERAGVLNTVTTRGMMEVLWSLATDTAVGADASKAMVGLIANSRTATSGAFAANPADSAAGETYQQALIVYGAHPFALAVVVHGLKSGAESAALVSKISHALAAAN